MLEIGTVVLNKYRVEREIGSGGMGSIYQARDRSGKLVCLKEARTDEDSIESLKEEAGILSQIHHWGVPRFYEAFEWNGHFIIVMELIQGITLADFIEKRGACNETAAAGWARQMCQILSYIHTRKKAIIHRDIKPSNIMLRPDGKIALLDFGIAREFKTGKLQDTRGLGTKGYAAPEQYGGMGQTDARTDIYSLGATLFYLVSGKNPTDALQEFPMVRKINPNISAGMENIIAKCTMTRPGERYQNAVEFAAAIDTLNHSKESGIGLTVLSAAIAVIGLALVLYETISRIPDVPIFIIGGLLIMAGVSLFIIERGVSKTSAPVPTGSTRRGVFLQRRDDFGSGNMSGKSSGSIKESERHGIVLEDSIWFLASDDWVSVLGPQ